MANGDSLGDRAGVEAELATMTDSLENVIMKTLELT